MRQQIVAVTAAVLLVALFGALWLSNLPSAPTVPYRAPRPQPTVTPTTVPPVTVVVTATPTPTSTPTPTPLPTPTREPTPVPTATPLPTPTPPQPTATPRPHFLEVHHTTDEEPIYGPPEIVITGSTLPWSIVEFIYSSADMPERDIRVRADVAGSYAGTVPLSEGTNVIEVIGYHGTSSGQARRFLQVDYAGLYPPLDLSILEPTDGFVTTDRVLTISGSGAAGAEVVINDLVAALPDAAGRWSANVLLQPGANTIRVVASRGDEALEATITVTFQPVS